MGYRITLVNGYVHLNISTNSKRIYRLVDNFLDFYGMARARRKVKVDFDLKEAEPALRTGARTFIYGLHRDKKIFAENIAAVQTDPAKGIVKGTVFHYQESCKEQILDFIFSQPLRAVLAHHNLFFLHASAVCRGASCILISGPQYSGKSTLALALTEKGFGFLTDDDCFVKLAGKKAKVFPFATKMGVTKNTLKKHPGLNKHLLRRYRYGKKRRVSLQHVFTPQNREGYMCRMVLFPVYRQKGGAGLNILPKEEALSRLIEDASTEKEEHRRRLLSKTPLFWTFHRLLDGATAFELSYNDRVLDKALGLIVNGFQT